MDVKPRLMYEYRCWLAELYLTPPVQVKASQVDVEIFFRYGMTWMEILNKLESELPVRLVARLLLGPEAPSQMVSLLTRRLMADQRDREGS